MRVRGKLAFAGLVAAAMLTAAVGTASANRLFINETRFTIKWPPPLGSGTAEEINPNCAITLHGSFNAATFVKRVGEVVGRITEFANASCSGGEITILGETLPWQVVYHSFTGALPVIRAVTIDVVGAAFDIVENLGGFRCLFRTTTTNPSRLIAAVEAGGTVTSLTADETARIPMAFPCELSEANFRGIGTMRTASEAAFVFRLI